MDGSVYNLNVPLDVDPKMYFRCTDLLQGVFSFLFYESLSEKQHHIFVFVCSGWGWRRRYSLPEIACFHQTHLLIKFHL